MLPAVVAPFSMSESYFCSLVVDMVEGGDSGGKEERRSTIRVSRRYVQSGQVGSRLWRGWATGKAGRSEAYRAPRDFRATSIILIARKVKGCSRPQ